MAVRMCGGTQHQQGKDGNGAQKRQQEKKS